MNQNMEETVNQNEIGWRKEITENTAQSNIENKSSGKNGQRKKTSSSSSSESVSSSSSPSSSVSSSSPKDDKRKRKREKKEKRREEKKIKKEERQIKKAQKKELKRLKKKQKKEEKNLRKLAKKKKKEKSEIPVPPECSDNFAVPIELMNYKAKAPETPEEYQARQNQIRRVVDPETGRTRLIKGEGEILEEIVPRDRHNEINRQATEGDGQFFQSKTVGWKFN